MYKRTGPLRTPTRNVTPGRPSPYAKSRVPLKAISTEVKRTLFPTQQSVISAEDVPIQMEEEINYASFGNVYERREFNFPPLNPVRQARRAANSLFDCISGGILNLDQAARLIRDQKEKGVFNKAVYEEFVSSDLAMRAVPSFDDIDEGDDPHAMWHNAYAQRLMTEINRANIMKIARNAAFAESAAIPSSAPQLAQKNCLRTWPLDAPYPFRKVELRKLSINWRPRKRDSPVQQLTALYRYVLLRITSPPEKIQQYSVRINRQSGRNENLENLPEEVEATMIGFAQDMLGYGHDELDPGKQVDLELSCYYLSLGSNERQRQENLNALMNERYEWRASLFTSLQKSLRDVRAYKYDKEKQKWLPSKKQSKRAVPQLDEDEGLQLDEDESYQLDEDESTGC